jgi:predicted nucleic-acid-binding protein
VLHLETWLTNIRNENELLKKLINEKQLIIEHRDYAIDQQRELLKGQAEQIDLMKGRLQQQDEENTTVQSTLDKRYRKADQVFK